MGTTTLTIEEEAKERLDKHRHEDHNSWTDVLHDLTAILPDLEAVHEDGCAACGETAWGDGPLPEAGGFVQFDKPEFPDGDGGYSTTIVSHWYCSKECVGDAVEEQEKYAAHDPDEVLVGGKNEPRATLTDASFHIDYDQMEVGTDIPGAFGGKSAHGGKYDYIGEPVFVKNMGETVHSGVVTEIIHEEGHTALILDHGGGAEARAYHPDEETREDARESWADWRDGECPECGESFQWCAKQDFEPDNHDSRDECPGCGAAIHPEDYDEGEGEPGVPPWEEE